MQPYKLTVLSFAAILFIQTNIYSQGRDRDKDRTEYNKAEKIYEKARKELKNDNPAEAEKLFWEALRIYPSKLEMFYLFDFRKRMKDARGLNAAYDSLLKSLRRYEEVIVKDPRAYVNAFSYTATDKLIVELLQERMGYNYVAGSMTKIVEDVQEIQRMGKGDEQLLMSISLAAILSGQFDIATKNLADLKAYNDKKDKPGSDLDMAYYYLTAMMAFEKKDYARTLQLCDHLEKNDKGINKSWQASSRLLAAETYAAMKDVDKAVYYLNWADKHIVYNDKKPSFNYTKGIVETAKGDYEAAVKSFTKNLEYKAKLMEMKNDFSTLAHRVYAGRAQAYIGMKDYARARKDYEIALAYYPEYEVAMEGLAVLEGKLVADRKTDKEPPVIEITEPSAARGLTPKSGEAEAMVRGLATDPGGIKEVFINGNPVFSRESGEFWGNVPLRSGMNKVNVKAVDFSGNVSEKVIEIEHTVIASSSNVVKPLREGKNYAILVGCQTYDDPRITSLDNPVTDVVKLKLILKNNYNYNDDNLFVLYNPSRTELRRQFLELSERIQPEDNLVIFYAGHGVWVPADNKGYWLLADANYDNINSWFSNKEVLDLIAGIPSRHTLLITDACFSGSVFKTRGIDPSAALAQRLSEKISRVAITSGNDTEVPDKSVFMKYLVKALSENRDKYIAAQKLFINHILEAVMVETRTEPRYGTLEMAGHVGGDFIFSRN